MARPTKRTPQLEAAIITALKAGSTRHASAEYVGVSRVQLWRWMESDVAFRNAVIRAESEVEVFYTTTLRKAAADDWRAAAHWLERRRNQDWGKRDHIDLTIRQEAERLAADMGLPLDEVQAEVDAILKARA